MMIMMKTILPPTQNQHSCANLILGLHKSISSFRQVLNCAITKFMLPRAIG